MNKTADLSDQFPEAAVLPVMFRDFGGVSHFEGPALTVLCYQDNSRIKELSCTPGKGRVLVVDGGGSTRFALIGRTIAQALADNGWAGAVVYGCVRDAGDLAAIPMGVKALATHPRKTLKQNKGQVGVPVDVGGVVIRSGDGVYADQDGVIVLPAETLTPDTA